MRVLATHLWKEWREHRAVWIGVLVSIPVVTMAAFIGLADHLPGLEATAPVFVGGAAALAALALATELFAGEQQRGTLAFLRRQPRGLSVACAAKITAYVFGIALAAAWGAVSFAASARWAAGARAGGLAWAAVTGDPTTYIWALCVAVFGAWVLLVSTWIPRGAAAAGAAAILLAAIGYPAYLLWGDHSAFWANLAPSVPRSLALVGAFALGLSVSCVLRGLRFSVGTWAAAKRGLAVLAVLVAGGYAYAASEFRTWAYVDPHDPEAVLESVHLGTGGRYVFATIQRYDDSATSRPLRIDLTSGEWEAIGRLGEVAEVPLEVGQACALAGGRVGSVVPVAYVGPPAWMDGRAVTLRWFDGDTGREFTSHSAASMAPEVLDRLERHLRAYSAVRSRDGRRAWVIDRRLRRETGDGGVEDVTLPGGARIVPVPYGAWGFGAWASDDHTFYRVDAFGDPASCLHPANVEGHGWMPYQSLDATRYLSHEMTLAREMTPARQWTWNVVDVDRKTVTPVPGLTADDRRLFCVGGESGLAWEQAAKATSGRLVRVEWATGRRTPVALGADIPGGTLSQASVDAFTASGAPVFSVTAGTNGVFWGYVVYDASKNALTRWTRRNQPWGWEWMLAPDGERGAYFVVRNRIVRVRWGSAEREVLFPR